MLHERKLVDFYYELKEPLGIDGDRKLSEFLDQCKERRIEIDPESEKQIIQQNKQKLRR